MIVKLLKEAIAEVYEFCGGSISDEESEQGFKIMDDGVAFQTTVTLTVRDSEAILSHIICLEKALKVLFT